MSSAVPIQPVSAPHISVDPLRRVCARFATGVVVLTAVTGSGQPSGVTVNSVASVSAHPPIAMPGLDRRSTFLQIVGKDREIVFNVLGERQKALSNRFECADRSFDGVHWSAPPVLDGSIADLRGSVRESIAMGDDAVVFADVLEVRGRRGRPLLFADSRYARLAD